MTRAHTTARSRESRLAAAAAGPDRGRFPAAAPPRGRASAAGRAHGPRTARPTGAGSGPSPGNGHLRAECGSPCSGGARPRPRSRPSDGAGPGPLAGQRRPAYVAAASAAATRRLDTLSCRVGRSRPRGTPGPHPEASGDVGRAQRPAAPSTPPRLPAAARHALRRSGRSPRRRAGRAQPAAPAAGSRRRALVRTPALRPEASRRRWARLPLTRAAPARRFGGQRRRWADSAPPLRRPPRPARVPASAGDSGPHSGAEANSSAPCCAEHASRLPPAARTRHSGPESAEAARGALSVAASDTLPGSCGRPRPAANHPGGQR